MTVTGLSQTKARRQELNVGLPCGQKAPKHIGRELGKGSKGDLNKCSITGSWHLAELHNQPRLNTGLQIVFQQSE